jgi:hypothetical protein
MIGVVSCMSLMCIKRQVFEWYDHTRSKVSPMTTSFMDMIRVAHADYEAVFEHHVRELALTL